MRRVTTAVAAVVVCASAVLVTPAATASAAGTDTGTLAGSYSGTLADGATWVADVPDGWNHTLVLYSHGYGSLTAQDAPDESTKTQLLAAGYGLVGSSYSGSSLWAVPTAVQDQFAALDAAEDLIGQPERTIAWGTSMGGLVSALEAQHPQDRIDGALTTCGLVAGALNINDYQLYGEYALSHLLAPAQDIKLVRYSDAADAATAAQALTTVVTDESRSARRWPTNRDGSTRPSPPTRATTAPSNRNNRRPSPPSCCCSPLPGGSRSKWPPAATARPPRASTSARSCTAAHKPLRSVLSTLLPASTSTQT
jgi:acetyl esterase/lipase